MNRRWAGVLIALAAILAVAAIFWLLRSPPAPSVASTAGPEVATGPAEEPAATPVATVADERWTVELYFPSASDRLVSETREIDSGPDVVARAAAVVATLLATKPAAPRVPVFPGNVEVGKVIALADGTIAVDLRSEDADPPPSGSTVELLRVDALVHSILRNVPEATQVLLLWNGSQRRSFAGHVDTSRPLRASGLAPASDEGKDP